ncbi:hypothetical protein ACFSKY_13610 [Azotobacter chroococcum]|uniref:Uncharacterized protein n=1 Tax=Azotobacter chroococcum TaxID=353 RepID=A0A4R1P7R7_9GAMM|nr:hypothetical protein [Azotobacter chroococcum]TCL21532.1 hypothetical protein EV691_1406 [Azotobacter chroococcum]
MKNFGAPALALTLRLPTFDSPHAAEASREIEEQTTGKSPGGMNGMLIGALFGGEAQEASGRPVPHRVLFLPSAPVPPARVPVPSVGLRIDRHDYGYAFLIWINESSFFWRNSDKRLSATRHFVANRAGERKLSH